MRHQVSLSPTAMPCLESLDDISPLSSPPSSTAALPVNAERDDGEWDELSSPSLQSSPSSPSSPTPPTYKIPRFKPAHPFRPISYPYSAAQISLKLRSTLRPRRRSSLYRAGQRRFLPILYALSIPILVLLLLHEWSTHAARTNAQVFTPNVLHHAPGVDLRVIREEHELRRRKEIVLGRSEHGNVRRGLKEMERGDMGNIAWTLEEEVQLGEEVKDVWPEWWGSADVVGRSPYDHIPQIEGRRRILFLTGEWARTVDWTEGLLLNGRLQGLPGANEHAHVRNCRCCFTTSQCNSGCMGSRMERLQQL
jgi:hypothetical protein